jgi:5-methylcytosine-specific restriction protein A
VTINRYCIGCGTPTRNGTRCPACERARNVARGSAHQRGYTHQWAKDARAAIARYRATHGDVCPAWDREPHLIAPHLWTCDHDVGPLCRACNSRKGATVDRPNAQARRRLRRALEREFSERRTAQDPQPAQQPVTQPPSVA